MKRQRVPSAAAAQGETRAALWLRATGWQILDRRVRTHPQAKLIWWPNVAANRFTEVKWRRRAADLDHAIDEYRLSRVAAAVEAMGFLRYATARKTFASM